jgi:hypothetical protein
MRLSCCRTPPDRKRKISGEPAGISERGGIIAMQPAVRAGQNKPSAIVVTTMKTAAVRRCGNRMISAGVTLPSASFDVSFV